MQVPAGVGLRTRYVMNRMGRPAQATLQEHLQTLVSQYRSEMQQFQERGGAGSPEAQPHLENANRIKDLLTRFHQQRQSQQQQAQMQAAQQHASQQQQQQQQPQGFDQQQLYAQQQHAQQGQQGAMANMRVMSGLQQQQQQIEEMRRVLQTLDQQLTGATSALRTVENEDARNRLVRSIQTMRSKREQLRQREAQALQNLQLARQRVSREPGAAGAQPQQPGQPQQAPPQQQQPAAAAAAPQQQQQQAMPQQMPGQAQPHQVLGQQTPGQPGTPQPGAVPPTPGVANVAGAVAQQTPASSNPGTPTMGVVTGRPTQSIPIPQQLNVAQPIPVAMPRGRSTLISGGAAGAAALNSPALARIPHFEVGSDRVLSKRRLSEMVAGILGEDSETLFDGDVEELLLDLADEFVTSVTTFACKLAKHRKSDTLEAKDVQMHLERNWNLRIPGFSSDEVRSIRKIAPTPGYQQKVQGVTMSKSVNK